MVDKKKIIKVAWICHFNNQEIQNKFGINKGQREFAPWITIMIEEIKKRNDIILYIIAPARNIISNKSFIDSNVNYQFYPVGIPFLKKQWPFFFRFDLWTGYVLNTFRIISIIKKLDIDIVNLIGAENAYYSKSVMRIKHLPKIVTIQGFIGLSKFNRSSKEVRTRIKVEKNILRTAENFGYRTNFMKNILLSYNATANFYEFNYPTTSLEKIIPNDIKKKFDIIFFARVTKNKGIEDLIYAIDIVKKEYPSITLKVVGDTSEEYFRYLERLIINLDLQENIEIVGFILTLKDVLKLAAQARISVLPTYNDIRSGTISESLELGLPIVAYKTGAIPEINETEKCVSLVEVGNIKELSQAIIQILKNKKLEKTLSQNAKAYAKKNFNNEHSIEKMINSYHDIINNYAKIR